MTPTIYDRLGRWYDVLTAFGESRIREAGLSLIAPQTGEVALELGCGTGHGVVALARSVGELGRVVGIDLSHPMLAAAWHRLRREGLASRVALARADARCLPVWSGAADAVFLSFTLELFADDEIPCVLAECRRVLRPAGRLGLVALDASGHASPMRSAYEWTHRRWPTAVDCRPILALPLLEAAGFEAVAARAESLWGLPVAVVLARRRPEP